METPTISIIVPVYKVEKYLSRCVESLLQQSYTNLEMILVDDGSPDKCPDICDRYAAKDSRIRVIHQHNAGVSAARNAALALAHGELIMFVDSDDWIDPDTCTKAVQAITEHNADVVLWPYCKEYGTNSVPVDFLGDREILWDGNARQILRRMVGPLIQDHFRPEQMNCSITAWGKLFRREVLSDIQFVDLSIIGTGEDLLFNAEAFFRVTRAVYTPDIHYHYWKDRTGSLTGRYKEKLAAQFQTLHSRLYQVLKSHGAPEDVYVALNHRIALCAIDLGRNIVKADGQSFRWKHRCLKETLDIPFYRQRIRKLPIGNMPIHWKVYFLCVKERLYGLALLLHYGMEWLLACQTKRSLRNN